jgi:hypothetical protein
MNVTPNDIQQITTLIDVLLLSSAFSALAFGIFIGWYVHGKYELWYWLKHGVYCDSCAPLIPSKKLSENEQRN